MGEGIRVRARVRFLSTAEGPHRGTAWGRPSGGVRPRRGGAAAFHPRLPLLIRVRMAHRQQVICAAASTLTLRRPLLHFG